MRIDNDLGVTRGLSKRRQKWHLRVGSTALLAFPHVEMRELNYPWSL